MNSDTILNLNRIPFEHVVCLFEEDKKNKTLYNLLKQFLKKYVYNFNIFVWVCFLNSNKNMLRNVWIYQKQFYRNNLKMLPIEQN